MIGGSSPGKSVVLGYLNTVLEIFVYPLIALLASVALLVFVWGAFEYVRNADNEVGRETGRQHMLYGVIGLVVLVSAFAIMELATNSLGLLGVFDAVQDENKSLYVDVESYINL